MTDPFIAKRYRSERLFRFYGAAALVISVLFLGYLIFDIGTKAWPSFTENRITLDVPIDPAKVDAANVRKGDFDGLVKDALRARFPEVTARGEKKKLTSLLSVGAADDLRDLVIANPAVVGTTLKYGALLNDSADLYLKGAGDSSDVGELEATFLKTLREQGAVENHLSWRFFTAGDSREPELAGLRGAIAGSLLTLLMTLTLSVPLGIAAALYLEEFAPKNKLTDFIEVNINNLAAVPSIIFGLLGLAIFINFFGMPRSAPITGGLVLALLVLPTIIIASRAAVRAVPPSIKEAALGVGASHQQAVFHHVLPLAVPGILTGTILGVARALGETAPLLMIGMVAFIVDIPKGLTDAATVLPVQIYLWSDLPEIAFQSRTAAAIIVLLVILFCFNAIAIYLRKRFERRW
jgi:phosphate transport system permease protein